MVKTAVITGAAGGIGAGLARECVKRGFQVVLADRDAGAVADLAASIGAGAVAVPTDVTDPASMEALAEQVYGRFGHADLLFNNAGVLSTGLSWEIPAERWRRDVDVNLFGVLNGIRAFVPRMIAADRPARIVNTASVGGFLPSPLMAPYSATKFAVVALTESVAGELKMLKSKVDVSLLAPGPVKSGIFRDEPGVASEAFHKGMTTMLNENGLDGDAFAVRVLDAVERGDYWIIPQPETFDPGFEARNRTISARTPPIFFTVEGE